MKEESNSPENNKKRRWTVSNRKEEAQYLQVLPLSLQTRPLTTDFKTTTINKLTEIIRKWPKRKVSNIDKFPAIGTATTFGRSDGLEPIFFLPTLEKDFVIKTNSLPGSR